MSPSLRKAGLGAASVVGVLLAVVLGAVIYIHTPAGERLATRLAEDAVAGLEVEALEISWPFTVSAGRMTMADAGGPWLRIDTPYLDWHPLRLARGVLDVDRISAGQVVVDRLPQAAAQQASDGGEKGGGLPRIRLRLDQVSAPIILRPPVLGEEVRLDLSGTLQMAGGDGEVDMHLRVADGGFIRVAGRAGSDYLDLRWYLRIPRLERWEKLAGQPMAGRLAGTGFVAGRLPHPAITGTLEMEQGRIAQAGWKALELAFRLVPSRDAWQSSLGLAIEAPALDQKVLVPSARLQASFEIAPARQTIRIEDARLAAVGMAVGIRGVVGQWGGDSDLTLTVNAADLDRLDALTGLGWQGRADAAITLSGDLRNQEFRAGVTLRTRDLRTGLDALSPILGARPMLRATVDVAPGPRIRVLSGRVQGAGARLEASGLAWPRLDMSASLEVPRMSEAVEGGQGAATLQARLKGPYDRVAAWGVAELDGVALAGAPPITGTLGFDLNDLTGTPQGLVTADATMAGRPVTGRARLVAGKVPTIEHFTIISGDSRAEGRLALGEDGLRGNVTASIPRLAAWQDIIGTPVSGAVSGRVRLRGEELAVQVNGRQMAAAGVAFDSLNASVQGTTERFDFQLDGSGPEASVAAAGDAVIQGPRGRVALDRLVLARQGREARLTGRTRLLWGPDGMRLEPVTLAAEGGQVTARGELVRGRLSAPVTVDDLPLALAELAAPGLGARGVVNGRMEVAGTLDRPLASLTLQGSQLGLAAASDAGLGLLTAQLQANWRDGRLQADLTARDGDRLRLAARGGMPVDLRGDILSAATPITANATVDGDLARLTEMLPLAGHAFAGRVSGAAQVGGTLGQPRVDGTIRLDEARYENLETGTIVENLEASAAIDGTRAVIQGRGTDGRDGRAILDAVAVLGGEWRGDLQVTDFRALRGDDMRATVSATMQAVGEGSEGRLAGDVTVQRAEVDIGRLQGGGPPTLDVVEVNRPGAPSGPVADAGDAKDETGPVTIALDLAVAIERAFVRGRGLDSEWGGDLKVAGTVADPRLTGALGVRRGQYEFLGRTFRLSPDSEVRFQGGEDIQPQLAILGTAKAGDITARVEVSGTADAPRIDIGSDPPLPQDEVLSQVLFGTEAGKLSAFQQIQLGQLAASGLGAGGGGFDPVGDLRGLLGLDVLEVGVGEEGEGGPSVSAGKYIGEDTFLRVEQGTSGSGSVTVEQQLGGGFSVTSELGDQNGGGVGLQWRKDY